MATITLGDSYANDGVESKELEAKETVEELKDESTEEETPEESSTSNESESVEEVTTEEEVVEEKEVVGLAAEKARLDAEIIALRAERRQLKSKDEQPILVDKKLETDLSDIAESDVALIDKVIKARGYVRQEDINGMNYKQQLDSFKDQWLEKHPEYLPVNDKEDKNWDALNSEVSNFYKSPQDPKDIIKILDRAHRAISSHLPTRTQAQDNASKEKIKVLSKGGGLSGTRNTTVKTKIDRNAFHGFTEEELNDLEN